VAPRPSATDITANQTPRGLTSAFAIFAERTCPPQCLEDSKIGLVGFKRQSMCTSPNHTHAFFHEVWALRSCDEKVLPATGYS
jgi:hypothetical protein